MAKKNIRSDQDIINAVKENYSMAGTLRQLNLCPHGGGSYYALKNRIKRLNLDTSHWTGQAYLKGKTHNNNKKTPLTEMLVDNKLITSSTSFKKRLIKEGLLSYNCSICKLSTWLEKPIVLQLDHINGNREDNRIDNLRLLCPNCHSQTETFCGKNKIKLRQCITCNCQIRRKNARCFNCQKLNRLTRTRTGTPVMEEVLETSAPTSYAMRRCNVCTNQCLSNSKSGLCKICYNKNRPNKIQWPSDEELYTLLQTESYLSLGKKLGVSDNAIRKRLNRNH